MTRLVTTSGLQVRIITSVACIAVTLLLVTIYLSSFWIYPYRSQDSLKSLDTPAAETVDMSNGLPGGSQSQNGKHDDLAGFLRGNKADFLKDFAGGNSLQGWVIVMGELDLEQRKISTY